MKRIAAKVVAPKRIELFEEELSALSPDEVLIKIAACGICQTEVAVFEGLVQGTPGVSFRYHGFPSDLGHEVVGIVADVGRDVTNVKVGQQVTGIIYSGCGFATYIVEKAKWLVPVPDKVSLSHALGEPIMCVTNIVRLSKLDFADTVYVIGTGFMALLTVATLRHYPLKNIIISGHYDQRLKMAERFGATLAINVNDQDPWAVIMEHTSQRGVDVVIELTGRMDMLRLGASVCKAKQQARLVMAGVYRDEPFTLGNYLQNRAPILVAAYPNQAPDMMDDLQRGMWAMEQGWFPMAELITHQFPLEEVARAIEIASTKAGGYIKGIIVPDERLF